VSTPAPGPRSAAEDEAADFIAAVLGETEDTWGPLFASAAEVVKHVEAGAALYTDALLLYEGLEGRYSHQVIDHAVKYVDGQVHTNGLENFWSLLKRGLNGTYVSVEPYHLFRYLDEQAYRYNNRKDANDFDRFRMAAAQIVGKRLTWKQTIGMQDGAAWAN